MDNFRAIPYQRRREDRRQTNTIIVSLYYTELGRRSFPVAAPTIWNSLPAHLRSTLISRRQFGVKISSLCRCHFWFSENIRYKSVMYLLTYLLIYLLYCKLQLKWFLWMLYEAVSDESHCWARWGVCIGPYRGLTVQWRQVIHHAWGLPSSAARSQEGHRGACQTVNPMARGATTAEKLRGTKVWVPTPGHLRPAPGQRC